jgi:molybdate transport system substrate-binding protein
MLGCVVAMVRGLLCATLLFILPVGQAGAEDLRLLAATSLAEVVEEIAVEYERASGNHVVLNLAGSNELARQILAGAPADVFFSADLAQMEVVERAGLVAPGRRIAALSNVLAVVVPIGAATTISSARDLLRVRRLAIADPDAVPAGVYARRWLESQGLWGSLADRVVPALNVRAALAAVETDAAEAGIVYRTDAAISRRVRVAFEVPREQGPEIKYVLAPLKASRSGSTAALVKALTSPSAAAAFERHGFLVLFPR